MNKSAALCLFCLWLSACSAQPVTPQPLITDKVASKVAPSSGIIRAGDWIIHHSPSELWVEHAKTAQRQVLYSTIESLRYCQDIAASMPDVEPEHYLEGAVISVVGELISYRYFEQGFCGGAHPFVSTSFKAYDLSTKQEVPLSAVFGQLDEVIEDAKLNPPILMSSFTPECEGAVQELSAELTSFAFHRLKGDQVVVRVGLSHSYELCRGTFAQVELTLTPSAALLEQLRAAKARGLLMEQLQPMMLE